MATQAISFARRSVIEQIDTRTDEQKIRDAVTAHLVNADRLNEIANGPASESLFGAAEKAFQDTQAHLWRVIEDALDIDPLALSRALAA